LKPRERLRNPMETPLRMAKRRSARRSTGLGSRRPARAATRRAPTVTSMWRAVRKVT
jgi:hypothetical protein